MSYGCSGKVVADVGESLVVKDNLEAALLLDTGGGASRNLFFATLERRTAKVVVTLASALVQGEIHVKAARDAQTFLSIEAGSFIPDTDATIHYLNADSGPAENAVAQVSRTFVSSLAFDS